MSVPIWGRMQRHSKIAKQRNALEKASAEYDQKRRDIESEVRRAVQDCEGTATAYLQAQRKSEVQAEAYNLNLKKMEQGLISPIEFRTASDNYINAKAEKIGSQLKLRLAECVVRYYNGISYIDQL